MANLFAVLLIVALIALILGLIKPSLFETKSNPKMSRLQIAIGGTVICLVLVALIGVFAPEVPQSNDVPDGAVVVEADADTLSFVPADLVKDEAKAETKVPVKIEPNLGMTPDEFRIKFNEKLKALKLSDFDQTLPKFDIKTGEVKDSFQLPFSDAISMVGIVNKDGMLNGVTFVMGHTTQGDNSGMIMLLISGITAGILNPNDNNQASSTVADLINKAVEGFGKDNNSHKKVVGNVEYSASASQLTGLMVGATPAGEK